MVKSFFFLFFFLISSVEGLEEMKSTTEEELGFDHEINPQVTSLATYTCD